MRRFKFLSYLISAMGLLTGCDLSYTVGEFWICNESGQLLYVESDIASELTSEKRGFLLEEGEANKEPLAKSPRFEGEQASCLSLSHCVNNEDAKVIIYTLGENGEKHLARTWYYSDRDKSGRELFSEKCLAQGGYHLHDGGSFSSFTFVVLPEDLESN